MAQPAATSRSREPPQGDEEASAELKLGEFQDVDALTHSEAALVINALVTKRRMDKKNVNETEYVFLDFPKIRANSSPRTKHRRIGMRDERLEPRRGEVGGAADRSARKREGRDVFGLESVLMVGMIGS